MDSLSVKQLTKWNLPPLRSVTTVSIELPKQEHIGLERFLLPSALQEIFPSVTEITLSRGLNTLPSNEIPESTEFKIPWPNVTKVVLKDYMLHEPAVSHLGLLFPKTRTITTPGLFNLREGLPFDLLSKAWPSLECIEVSEKLELVRKNKNFDAVFCGIHPEEAELLRPMDDEFLEKVNILPPFPALHHLRGLKRFVMEATNLESSLQGSCSGSINPSGRDGELFLSRVTPSVAFRQLQDFKFQLILPAEDSKYVEHLRPFVHLYLLPRKFKTGPVSSSSVSLSSPSHSRPCVADPVVVTMEKTSR